MLNPGVEQNKNPSILPHGNMKYEPPNNQEEDFTDEEVGLRYYIRKFSDSYDNL